MYYYYFVMNERVYLKNFNDLIIRLSRLFGDLGPTELKDLLLDNLSSERLKREGLFNQAMVEKKLKEHLSGQFNHYLCLWPLLMWEMWRERWLNGV